MADWKFDSNQHGLETVLFKYEIEALSTLWEKNGEYLTSRQVYQHVREKMNISRASIINSLNRMAKLGILGYKETTGKGGVRGLYAASMDEAAVRRRIADELIQSIKKNLD